MKGRPGDKDRAAEIRRLWALGYPVAQIAHQLRCSDGIVDYYLKGRIKGKCGVKPGTKPATPYKFAGKDLKEHQIDEIMAGATFDDEPKAARFKNQEETC